MPASSRSCSASWQSGRYPSDYLRAFVQVRLLLNAEEGELDGFLILGLVQVNRLPYSWVEARGKAIGFMNNVGHSKAHG